MTDRSLKVKFDKELSDVYEVNYRTSQGSNLGPLIYMLFSNNIRKILWYSNTIVFADDTTVYISGRIPRLLKTRLQTDLNNLHKWFGENSLTLNISKTNFMLFTPVKENVCRVKDKGITNT